MKSHVFIGVGAVLFASSHAFAHAIPTHQNITRAAVEYLRSKAPEFGCFNDSLVQIGTEHEDDWPRFMFHFYPALNDRSYIATCSSRVWGLSRAATCTQHGAPTIFNRTMTNAFSWPVAVDHASNSQTNEPAEQGWVELGYVLHLLEDLTSPAHVRNDAHPSGWLMDGDPVESETRTPKTPTGQLISLSSPEAYFDELQTWTQSHFFSNDTCFSSDLPGPEAVRHDRDYFYDAEGNKIAYRSWRYMLSGLSDATRNKRRTNIDDTIADEQFDRLGPQAVLYGASLMKFYSERAHPLISPIRNGGAEAGDLSGWVTDTTFGYATASLDDKAEGRYSARIGRWDQPYQQGGCFRCGSVPGAEPDGVDFMYQDITLPATSSSSLTLNFDYNVVTYDGANYDWFDTQISDATTNALLGVPVSHVGGIIAGSPANWGLFYTTGWRHVSVDLSAYAGRKVRLSYLVTQDGFGDQIATYVDRVQLSCR